MDEDWVNLPVGDCLSQPWHEIFEWNRPLVEEFLHQTVVTFSHHFDDGFMPLRRSVLHAGGDVDGLGFPGAVGLELIRLHLDKVDDAPKVPLGPNRQLNRDRGSTETFL